MAGISIPTYTRTLVLVLTFTHLYVYTYLYSPASIYIFEWRSELVDANVLISHSIYYFRKPSVGSYVFAEVLRYLHSSSVKSTAVAVPVHYCNRQ